MTKYTDPSYSGCRNIIIFGTFRFKVIEKGNFDFEWNCVCVQCTGNVKLLDFCRGKIFGYEYERPNEEYAKNQALSLMKEYLDYRECQLDSPGKLKLI